MGEADGYQIRPRIEHDRRALGRPLGRERGRRREGHDHVDFLRFETARRLPRCFQVSPGITHMEDEVLAFFEPQLLEAVAQSLQGLFVRTSPLVTTPTRYIRSCCASATSGTARKPPVTAPRKARRSTTQSPDPPVLAATAEWSGRAPWPS